MQAQPAASKSLDSECPLYQEGCRVSGGVCQSPDEVAQSSDITLTTNPSWLCPQCSKKDGDFFDEIYEKIENRRLIKNS
jgi:hypothetical protein